MAGSAETVADPAFFDVTGESKKELFQKKNMWEEERSEIFLESFPQEKCILLFTTGRGQTYETELKMGIIITTKG